jgi:hypothetical protein
MPALNQFARRKYITNKLTKIYLIDQGILRIDQGRNLCLLKAQKDENRKIWIKVTK